MNFSESSSNTLIVPLEMRVIESKKRDGLFRDLDAELILQRLGRTVPKLTFQLKGSQVGTAIRVAFFDSVAEKFIKEENSPVIISLGCGLDTRFSRIDNEEKGIHIDIDLPDVIEIREKIYPSKNKRNLYWKASVLETNWMERLNKEYGGKNFLFIMEGVSMYLEKTEMMNFLKNMAEYFPQAQLWFDTSSTRVNEYMNRMKKFQQLGATFKWGLDSPEELKKVEPRVNIIEVKYYMDQHIRKWGLWYLLSFVTPFKKGSRMIGVKFE